MRLISYYALHSFINGIKKLFKTWFIIFIAIMMLFGILMGFFLDTVIPEDEVLDTTEIEEIEEIEEEPTLTVEERTKLFDFLGMAIVVLILTLVTINADKGGSKIFQGADVALLFSSPLKPQFVLLFRMLGQIGALLIGGIYLLFQIPNLIEVGFSTLAGVGLFVTYFLTLSFGELLSVLIYSIATTHRKFIKYIKGVVLFVPIALIVYFGIYYFLNNGSSTSIIDILDGAFNFKASRFIPIIGNLKGMFSYTLEGNIKGFLLEILYAIISIAALGYIIWQIDCDFYEDALIGSEEVRALTEKAERTGFAVKTKVRSEKIKRNELNHGFGANALFYKEMYNRFRFAKLGIMTNTMITYLSICVPLMILLKFVIHINTFLITSLVLGGMSFYRSLGDSIHQDIEKPFFILIPEKTNKKFFYSLISGTVNCALDILPILLISEILDMGNISVFILSIVFITSLNFYSQSIGAFLDLSTVEKNAGKNIKLMIQLLFIYFGLIPDICVILVLTLGLGFEFSVIMPYALVLSSILNVILGLPFLFTAPLFIDPKVGRKKGTGDSYSYEGR